MMNCIAVDDEPLALNLIEDNIKRIPFLNLVKKCKNAATAFDICNSEKIDLIFMDIEMPDISGIEFIRSLKNKPMVIFITAYEKYALEGFELDVIDYLLKPASFDRFLKAVNKANEYFSFVNSKIQPSEKYELIQNYIFVKSDHKIIKIEVNDILYIEGLKDYVKIYTGGKPIFTLMSLKYLEEKLSPGQFIRIHRSFIINLSKIDYIGKSKVNICEESIPISNFYRNRLFDLINNNTSSHVPIVSEEDE
jgi:DNA-binding LytR/AlgR family response regulator